MVFNLTGAWIVSELIGKKRQMGYKKSLKLSLLFTPIIGIIITYCSPKSPFEVN